MELWVQKKNYMKTCSEKHSKTRKALCIFLDVTENALASSMPFNDTLGWMETRPASALIPLSKGTFRFYTKRACKSQVAVWFHEDKLVWKPQMCQAETSTKECL